MRCCDVQSLLPRYADDALPERERERVSAHVEGCAGCRRELATLERALEALNSAGRQGAPDLWERFQARLQDPAPEVSCRQARALLPGHLDGLLDAALQPGFARHLAGCAACA